jgi:DNA-binding NarL/FixJ family response regulator
MQQNKTTILIADDHPLFRTGVKQVLTSLNYLEIYEAENGIDAIGIIRGIKPDVAVIDLRMPGKTGLEILSELYEEPEPTKILLLTMDENITYFYQAVSSGAKGYLLKETAVDELT